MDPSDYPECFLLSYPILKNDNPHFIDEKAESECSDSLPAWQNRSVSGPNAVLQDSLHCFLQVLYCFFAVFCTWMNDGVVVHTACSLKGNQMYGLCSDAKINNSDICRP